MHALLTHHFYNYYTEMNFNPMIQAVNAMGNLNTEFPENSTLFLRLSEDCENNIQGDDVIQFNFIFENGTAGEISCMTSRFFIGRGGAWGGARWTPH